MGGDGLSTISAGVGGMVNGAGLTLGSIERSGASGSGSTVGAKTHVDNELSKVRWFSGDDIRGFGKKVLG